MSNKQRIKSFNEPAYRYDLNQGIKDGADAKRLDDCIKVLNGWELKGEHLDYGTYGMNSLEKIEEALNEQTGFKNARMSADSLNLLEEYETFKKLSNKINLWEFNQDFSDYTPQQKDLLREQHTIYWSKEETKIIENTASLLDKINKLPQILRLSILENTRTKEYTFSDSNYSMFLSDKERAEKRAKK
tara:strand:+ start:1737 stop:2300 length:564 start_codon:yes stop_codon:yes gene_type:complete